MIEFSQQSVAGELLFVLSPVLSPVLYDLMLIEFLSA